MRRALVSLPALFTLVLPACDPVEEAGEPQRERPVGGVDRGSAVAEDFGREGEPCEGTDTAPCRADGAEGFELCHEGAWSECLTEPCEALGEGRDCEGGRQYCASFFVEGEDVAAWGMCIEPECEPGETTNCGLGGEFSDWTTTCSLDPKGVPSWNDEEDCWTPLVLSFGDAIEFSPAPARAADFDMRGDGGRCSRVDWPAAATPWLALDRDGSGEIEGGAELFGGATRLASGGRARNGFEALAELDSDGDRQITPADARWGELVLWADHDGDRRSSGWELLPLASFEVRAIELDYVSRRECDAAGNCGVERARFVFGAGRRGEVVDVHGACE